MATSDSTLKRCSRKENCCCPASDNGWLPATTEYFAPNKSKGSGLNSYCRWCMSEYSKRHKPEYSARPEVRERTRQWERDYAQRPYVKQKIRTYHNAFYSSPEQKAKRRVRSRKPDYLQKKSARMKVYRQLPDVKARDQQYHREYMQAHKPEYAANSRVNGAKRRARKRNLPGKFTKAEFALMCQVANHQCAACGSVGHLTADHVIPIASGGCNCIHNIQPLCRRCNSGKRDRHATDYRSPEIHAWLTSLPSQQAHTTHVT